MLRCQVKWCGAYLLEHPRIFLQSKVLNICWSLRQSSLALMVL